MDSYSSLNYNDYLAAIVLRNLSRNSFNNSLSDVLNRSFVEQEETIKPTSKEFINKLEAEEIKKEDLEKNACCSICQDTFKEGQKIFKLPCPNNPHYFCAGDKPEECEGILPWLKENNSCPVCRFELPIEKDISPPEPMETPPEPTESAEPSESLSMDIRYQLPVLASDYEDGETTSEEQPIGYRLVRRRIRFPNISVRPIRYEYTMPFRIPELTPEPEITQPEPEITQPEPEIISSVPEPTEPEPDTTPSDRLTPSEITALIPDVLENIRNHRIENQIIDRINSIRNERYNIYINYLNDIRSTINEEYLEDDDLEIEEDTAINNPYISEYDEDGFNTRDLDEAIRQSLQ